MGGLGFVSAHAQSASAKVTSSERTAGKLPPAVSPQNQSARSVVTGVRSNTRYAGPASNPLPLGALLFTIDDLSCATSSSTCSCSAAVAVVMRFATMSSSAVPMREPAPFVAALAAATTFPSDFELASATPAPTASAIAGHG